MNAEIRPGAQRARVVNSGLEVWLYDESHTTAIRDSGAIEKLIEGNEGVLDGLIADGVLVGYSLLTDGGVDVSVIVGEPLSAAERAVTDWLEPQAAFLRVPSGRLCIDSNDTSRIGPEKPGDGATLEVPPGDYKLMLYRIDHEALKRREVEWEGPEEVIVLTPGGTPSHAARGLLPFETRREDPSGRYTIHAGRFDGFVWFPDYWDSFYVNLDSKAAVAMELKPGQLLSVTCAAAGLCIKTRFLESHPPIANEEKANPMASLMAYMAAEQLAKAEYPAPRGVKEYAYGRIAALNDWAGKEFLHGKRSETKVRIKPKHLKTWFPVVVEIEAAG